MHDIFFMIICFSHYICACYFFCMSIFLFFSPFLQEFCHDVQDDTGSEGRGILQNVSGARGGCGRSPRCSNLWCYDVSMRTTDSCFGLSQPVFTRIKANMITVPSDFAVLIAPNQHHMICLVNYFLNHRHSKYELHELGPLNVNIVPRCWFGFFEYILSVMHFGAANILV